MEQGVVINGLRWAICNVNSPGTFTNRPEDAGKFYQWGVGSPCPIGWRLPTFREIETLLDNDKVSSIWTTVNGVYGRRFTDRNTGNSIFLPAAGWSTPYGERGSVGDSGNYWSNERTNGYCHYLYFCNSYTDAIGAPDDNNLWCSIRPVAI